MEHIWRKLCLATWALHRNIRATAQTQPFHPRVLNASAHEPSWPQEARPRPCATAPGSTEGAAAAVVAHAWLPKASP
eukprot:1121786-Alexandrium_andersonii.AAC.1